jgi:hypothetical protein
MVNKRFLNCWNTMVEAFKKHPDYDLTYSHVEDDFVLEGFWFYNCGYIIVYLGASCFSFSGDPYRSYFEGPDFPDIDQPEKSGFTLTINGIKMIPDAVMVKYFGISLGVPFNSPLEIQYIQVHYEKPANSKYQILYNLREEDDDEEDGEMKTAILDSFDENVTINFEDYYNILAVSFLYNELTKDEAAIFTTRYMEKHHEDTGAIKEKGSCEYFSSLISLLMDEIMFSLRNECVVQKCNELLNMLNEIKSAE